MTWGMVSPMLSSEFFKMTCYALSYRAVWLWYVKYIS